MTPQSNEDLVRWALHTSATSRQEHYAALDALVAERDRLAARLAEAEQARASLRLELDGLEFVRVKDNGYLIERAEAAEERGAALTEALRHLIEWADDERGDAFGEREWADARAALAAADRPEGTIVRDQTGCARCDGEGHRQVTYLPLTFPIDMPDGFRATHWAPCPTNGEPILLCFGPKPDRPEGTTPQEGNA